MNRVMSFVVVVAVMSTVNLVSIQPESSATPSNGSLLVPTDITVGNYWATPTDSIGGYVEVCADYSCDVGAGMIENYTVKGRTMVVVPFNARMVNVADATLTPVNMASAATPPASAFPTPIPAGTPGLYPGDACSSLHATAQDGIGQTMWCNPLMTGDHSLHWMYGGAA